MNEISAEQLVADRVNALSQHITENRFHTITNIAVDALQKNESVPVIAFLHATKTAWCNHEIAVRTMTQLQNELKAADQARANTQYAHNKLMQAEQEIERLKSELAQSVLLVENKQQELNSAFASNEELRQSLRALKESLHFVGEPRSVGARQQLDAATAVLQKQHPDHIGMAISTEELNRSTDSNAERQNRFK